MWNSKYALQWQCMKTIMFLYCEASNAFIGAFCYSKIILHPSGPFQSIKTMLESFHVLLGLSPVWNCYPKLSCYEEILRKEHIILTLSLYKLCFLRDKLYSIRFYQGNIK